MGGIVGVYDEKTKYAGTLDVGRMMTVVADCAGR